MTKAFLAKLGITIETDEIGDEEGQKLIEAHVKGLTTEKDKNKKLVDDYSSQIAEFKKEKQSRLTDEEKRQQELADLQKQVAESNRKLALKDKVADLVELGYDKETAIKYATDELDGKSTIQYQKDFKAKIEAETKAQLLKGGNPPIINNNDNPPSKEDVIKGGIPAMEKLAKEQPEVYKQYFGE